MSRSTKLTKSVRVRILTADSHYAVLGVAPRAPADVIKQAHRLLAKLVHPDRLATEDAHDLMTRVNLAYACLGDAAARRRYDVVNNTTQDACAVCKGTGFVFVQRGFAPKLRRHCTACGGAP